MRPQLSAGGGEANVTSGVSLSTNPRGTDVANLRSAVAVVEPGWKLDATLNSIL